ncbi:alkaline phosphatase family protein [Enterococcus sp.]|uniref:alkaline phosphatase family protein n=1 Tax=Enterococcus sp. TaxID=35783 RepID=UPI0025C0E2B7|nr:alkaline phosphatase family protein [Enterococcus sp.]
MPAKTQMTEKLLLLVLDGCRYDIAMEQMGVLNHYVDYKQAQLIKVLAEMPSSSRALDEVLATGVPSYRNGILANADIRLSKERSLFDLVKTAGGITAAAAHYWQSELFNQAPYEMKRDRIQHDPQKGIQHGIFYNDNQYPDSHVFADGHFLLRTYQPHLLLIQARNIAETGHRYTSNSKEYRQSVSQADQLIGVYLQDWLAAGYQVLVTASHGMDEYGLHGGSTAAQREVPLYIFSDIFPPDCGIEKMNQLEVAPLICSLLKIDTSERMQIGRS